MIANRRIVAAIGGGIPVAIEGGELTGVDNVYIDFNTPRQRKLGRVGLREPSFLS
jgi:carbamate kinase